MNFFNLLDDLGLLNEQWEGIHVRESFVNCSILQKKLNTTSYTPYANSYRIIYLYIQNEGAKQTEQNIVGFVTPETKFSAEHRNKPGMLIYMLHCCDCTSENKTFYQRRGQR